MITFPWSFHISYYLSNATCEMNTEMCAKKPMWKEHRNVLDMCVRNLLRPSHHSWMHRHCRTTHTTHSNRYQGKLYQGILMILTNEVWIQFWQADRKLGNIKGILVLFYSEAVKMHGCMAFKHWPRCVELPIQWLTSYIRKHWILCPRYSGFTCNSGNYRTR